MDAVAVVLMGVTGCGKTTVGRLLEDRLGWPFLDGDDYHPEANVARMAAGVPLRDEDRWPWLRRLSGEIGRRLDAGRSCLLGCSALKEAYREVLRGERGERVRFVHLCAPEALIADRLRGRVHRYMPAGLLRSQFEALEPPLDAALVDVSGTPEEAAEAVVGALGLDA